MSGSAPQSEFLIAKERDVALKGIQAPVVSELDLVQGEIEAFFDAPDALLQELVKYVAKMPGKKLRPTLLLLVAGLGGKASDAAIKAAAMVELVHTATLIHDDSIDRSLLRRGLPTINSLWSDRVSVILGDYLYTKAFYTLVEAENWDVVEVMSRTAHRMTIGEMLEVEQKDDITLEEEAYLRLISEKTASLFSASCEIGAILAGCDARERERFREFGQDLGTAFQITDDLFDYTGDSASLGKGIASDLTEGKLTLPIILGLREAPDDISTLVSGVLKARSVEPEAWKRLIGYLDESGTFRTCRGRAEDFANQAGERLADCQDSVFKSTLAMTVKFATHRCH